MSIEKTNMFFGTSEDEHRMHRENKLKEIEEKFLQIEKIYNKEDAEKIFDWHKLFDEIKEIDKSEAGKFINEKLNYMEFEHRMEVKSCIGVYQSLWEEKERLGYDD